MATNQTEHYSLNQWVLSDDVRMEDFNTDNQKVDAALAALDKRIDAAVAQATQKVNEAAAAAAQNLAAVQATIPRVQTGTYVGTGTYGADDPNTLTFDFTPKLVIISEATRIQNGSVISQYITRLIAVHGTSVCPTDGEYLASKPIATAYLTWGKQSLSWYSDSATAQGNYEDITYHYIAIG